MNLPSIVLRMSNCRAIACCVFVLTANLAEAAVFGTVDQNGFIVVHGEAGDDSFGLDFVSAGSNLIPIPPGDLTASADPFQVLLANNPGRVTYGSLTETVSLEGSLTLGVGVQPGTDTLADISAVWGDGLTAVSFPVVPEPSSALLALWGALALLGFRRR